MDLPTRGFSVLPAVVSVPEHRPIPDIRRYYISTSAAPSGGRRASGRHVCLMVRGTTGGQHGPLLPRSYSSSRPGRQPLRYLPASSSNSSASEGAFALAFSTRFLSV